MTKATGMAMVTSHKHLLLHCIPSVWTRIWFQITLSSFLPQKKKKKTTVTTKDKRRVKYVGAYVGCMANIDETQISSAG